MASVTNTLLLSLPPPLCLNTNNNQSPPPSLFVSKTPRSKCCRLRSSYVPRSPYRSSVTVALSTVANSVPVNNWLTRLLLLFSIYSVFLYIIFFLCRREVGFTQLVILWPRGRVYMSLKLTQPLMMVITTFSLLWVVLFVDFIFSWIFFCSIGGSCREENNWVSRHWWWLEIGKLFILSHDSTVIRFLFMLTSSLLLCCSWDFVESKVHPETKKLRSKLES